MDFINAIEPSLSTLLVVLILPFFYFGLHIKYWYNPVTLKQGDFLLSLAAIMLAGIVLVKLVRMRGADFQEIQLTLMHLAPLVLTLLIVSQGRRGIGPRYASANKESSDTDYSPVPLNKEIQKMSWDDLIIDQGLRAELISVVELLKDPKTTKKYGIDVPKGILLTGPPGTGKTSVARVIANTANLSFFVLGMDQVVSKWVGESEKNLTKLFEAAKRHSPAVIFIDEVDSIGRGRSSGGQQWAENLLNHLLQLIDGVVKTEGLYIIAATNRADLVDAALKRAGRLNKVIEIPLPHADARQKLFELYLRKLPLEENVDLSYLAGITDGKSGADIKEICNQAGLNAFKRESGGKRRSHLVSYDDIQQAIDEFMRQGNAEPEYY